jgi:tRNA (cmo5U34)-methyltransferase
MADNFSSHNSTDYDKSILKTIPYYDCIHNETINLVKSIFHNSKSWLDTGCGTGKLIEKALTVFPDFKYYLADPSLEMLKICEKKFKNNQIDLLGNYDTIGLNINVHVDIITAI